MRPGGGSHLSVQITFSAMMTSLSPRNVTERNVTEGKIMLPSGTGSEPPQSPPCVGA
jgi:hypothetical protein